MSLIQRFVPEADFSDNTLGGGIFPKSYGDIPVCGEFDLEFRRIAEFSVLKNFLDILVFPLSKVRIIFQRIDDVEPLIQRKSVFQLHGVFLLLFVEQCRLKSAVFDFKSKLPFFLRQNHIFQCRKAAGKT